MVAKKVIRNKVWEPIEKGVTEIVDTVKLTLGPRGRNVILEKNFSTPLVINDGVTIAKEITLKDRAENLGATLLKEIASKTNDVAGDGTTTAMVLGGVIFKEGLKSVVVGSDLGEIRKGINEAANLVINELEKSKKTINAKEEVKQVATISANNDFEIGELIASAMESVGNNGVITIEESKTVDTTLDVVEGMQFNEGYISHYFVRDKEKMEVSFENPLIFITEERISAYKDILPILDAAVKANKKLLVIADSIEGDALATMIINNLKGMLDSVAVKAPGFGGRKKEILEDIAVSVGAQVLSNSKGMSFEGFNPEWFGTANMITVRKDEVVILEGKGTKEDVDKRVSRIKEEINSTDTSYEKEKLHERLAKLSGGIAVIRAGAATETELREKKHRIEDALSATRAAVEEGIIAGGGAALLHTYPSVVKLENRSSGDFKIGVSIIRKAIKAPFLQILENAGEAGEVAFAKIVKKSNTYGFDARKLKFIDDMLKEGIVDPLKVTKNALLNAISVASLLLTTQALVIEIPEDNKNNNSSCNIPTVY